jgi:hypothetical protein
MRGAQQISNKTRQGNKQMPKSTNEEENKSQQTLGMKKQKTTSG